MFILNYLFPIAFAFLMFSLFYILLKNDHRIDNKYFSHWNDPEVFYQEYFKIQEKKDSLQEKYDRLLKKRVGFARSFVRSKTLSTFLEKIKEIELMEEDYCLGG